MSTRWTVSAISIFLPVGLFLFSSGGCDNKSSKEESSAGAGGASTENGGSAGEAPRCLDDCQCPEDAACEITDLFTLDHQIEYQSFGTDHVRSENGFGIYWDDYTSRDDEFADIDITFGDMLAPNNIGSGGAGGAGGELLETFALSEQTLFVTYDLDTITYYEGTQANLAGDPYSRYATTAWTSIRREFIHAQSFCGCTGIEIGLNRISGPTHLRLTIADIYCQARVDDHGSDELYWKDIYVVEPSTWVTTKVPFEEFELAEGSGTRSNDNVLGLNCLVAIEISAIYRDTYSCYVNGDTCEEPTDRIDGSFLARNLRTYAD